MTEPAPIAVARYDRGDWRIVHVATGLGLVRLIRNESAARDLLARLLAAGLDWSIETVLIPAVEAMPGRELGAFGMTPRPAQTSVSLASPETRTSVSLVQLWALDMLRPDPLAAVTA